MFSRIVQVVESSKKMWFLICSTSGSDEQQQMSYFVPDHVMKYCTVSLYHKKLWLNDYDSDY